MLLSLSKSQRRKQQDRNGDGEEEVMNIPELGGEKSSNRRQASETSDTSEKGNEDLH